MATNTRRDRKGGARYTAQIRIRRDGSQHAESRTFSRRALAVAWAERRGAELLTPDGLVRATHPEVTVGALISRDLADRESVEPLGRSKRGHLELLLRLPSIAERSAL